MRYGTIPVIIPIADRVHLCDAAFCALISFIYVIYILCKKLMEKDEYLIKRLGIIGDWLAGVMIISVICWSAYSFANYIQDTSKNQTINHFKYIPVDENYEEEIGKMKEFIEEEEKKGKTVHILDMVAPLYMIPLDRYSKNYDLFNLGNFGGRGTERNYRRYKGNRKSCTSN